MKTGAIILAAGASIRLGEPKQLLEFRGKTLLRRTAETAIASNCSPIVVILGANAEQFAPEIKNLKLKIAVNSEWQNGMSASIRAGLLTAQTIEPNISAVVLLLCDQPFVNAATIVNLIEKFNETAAPIVVCEYENTIGVPVLFQREMFDELLNLTGETGAKFLIKKHRARLARINAPEAAFDVDTPQDWQKLLAR